MKIVSFFKRSKEKRAIKYAKKLRNVLLDLGEERASESVSKCIYIWDFCNNGKNYSWIENTGSSSNRIKIVF